MAEDILHRIDATLDAQMAANEERFHPLGPGGYGPNRVGRAPISTCPHCRGQITDGWCNCMREREAAQRAAERAAAARTIRLGTVACPHCGDRVDKATYMLHEPPCRAINGRGRR